jgi:hypothetical protein
MTRWLAGSGRKRSGGVLTADRVYRTAISELTYLASLPDSGDTPAQIKKAEADHAALNSFFKTLGQS